MQIHTIVVNEIPIGFFYDIEGRDKAFEKYIKPILSKNDNFIKGVR